MTESLNVVTPKRADMQTMEGAEFTKRFQEFVEELVSRLNELIIDSGGLVLDQDRVQELILEFAGLQSDPLSALALAEIKDLQDTRSNMEQQIAELEANISQLRAQAMNQDDTLEAIQDTDDVSPLRAKISTSEENIDTVFENAGALASRSW